MQLSIGRERRPLLMVDGFADDADTLRAFAAEQPFEPALNHYPGLRARLPAAYWADRLPLVGEMLAETFELTGGIRLIDASFSIVTTPRDALSVAQRLPHCDAFASNRIAMVHYLSPTGGDGTAFFRHRSTGFETVSDERRPIYFNQIEAELRLGGPPRQDYIASDTALFERTLIVGGHYNRALFYRSNQLHSGAIAPDNPLIGDARRGRLTVTAFFSFA